jgi:hypothetical protein
MMVSGVRSACAALAVKRRWMTNMLQPVERLIDNDDTRERPVGQSAAGRRSAIDSGPIALDQEQNRLGSESGRLLRLSRSASFPLLS